MASCPVLISLRSESTRLNSSHVRISYAVFCLKKKTYLTMVKTARSVTTMSTTSSPVSCRLHFLSSFAPSLAECSITTTTRLTTATRSIAQPRPLNIVPGIIQLERSPFYATCMALRIERSMCPPRIMPQQPELETYLFNDTAPTVIYTLSLHDALPI